MRARLLIIVRAIGVTLLLALASFSIVLAQTVYLDSDFAMPYPKYTLTQGCHPDAWGDRGTSWCAIDLQSRPKNGPLYSPIQGTVILKGSNDGYSNPFIAIQNSRFTVYMLHGIYDRANKGDYVYLGQRLGTEASIGNSTGPHTHLAVFDRQKNKWVDPRTIVTIASPGGNEGGNFPTSGIPPAVLLVFAIPLLLVVIARPKTTVKAVVWGIYWTGSAARNTTLQIIRHAGCSATVLALSIAVIAFLVQTGGTPSPPINQPEPGGHYVRAKISHYWPPLGGPNCSRWDPVKKKCLSRMASGLPWEDWVDQAVACPTRYPFWTRVYAFNREWYCLDRGGAINVNPDGTIWLDFLTEDAPVPFGQIVEVYILPPSQGDRNR